MKTERASLANPEILSRQAQATLMGQSCWHNARVVALYMAIHGETGAGILLEKAWAEGKVTLLPKVVDSENMIFAPVKALSDLIPGAFGIPEPPASSPDQYADLDADLAVIPGLAFDSRGYRLGYGGGFYDRFFARQPSFAKIKIGLCFYRQLAPRVPHGEHDISVNAICTEQGFFSTTANLS